MAKCFHTDLDPTATHHQRWTVTLVATLHICSVYNDVILLCSFNFLGLFSTGNVLEKLRTIVCICAGYTSQFGQGGEGE